MMSGNIDINKYTDELIKAGVDRDDARLEVSLFADYSANEDEFVSFIRRRISGEPMAYILGEKDFYRDTFTVREGVLIPRSDTEILVESALQFAAALSFPTGDIISLPHCSRELTELKMADFCTGTGCVGISVYKELISAGRKVSLCLTDISDKAIDCAGENIDKLIADKDAVRIIREDVLSDITCLEAGSFDMILSNPPYINKEDMDSLDDIVGNNEPKLALEGGEDGLLFYAPIAKKAQMLLKEGGALIVEHGYDQGEKIREIMQSYGFKNVTTVRDYASVDRVTFGVK